MCHVTKKDLSQYFKMILELRSNFLIHFKLDSKFNEAVAIVRIMINKHVGKG